MEQEGGRAASSGKVRLGVLKHTNVCFPLYCLHRRRAYDHSAGRYRSAGGVERLQAGRGRRGVGKSRYYYLINQCGMVESRWGALTPLQGVSFLVQSEGAGVGPRVWRVPRKQQCVDEGPGAHALKCTGAKGAWRKASPAVVACLTLHSIPHNPSPCPCICRHASHAHCVWREPGRARAHGR